MLEPMSKVRVFGKKPLLGEFLAVLGEAGLVHLSPVRNRTIDGFNESELFTACEVDAASRARSEKLRDELRLIEEAGSLLGVEAAPYCPRENVSISREELHRDLERIRKLSSEKEKLEEDLALAKRYRKLASVFGPVMRDLGEMRHVRAMGVTVEARYRDQLLPALREKLEEITGGGYQLLWRFLDEDLLGVVILFPPASAEAVASLLAEKNIHEMRLPKSYEHLPFFNALTLVEEQLSKVPATLEGIRLEFDGLRKKYSPLITCERQRLRREIEESEVASGMSCTRFLFVCEGYLPEKDLSGLKRVLGDRFGDDVTVTEIEITSEERQKVPVSFSNPGFFRPFERMLRILPLPRYGTIDPTPLMALSFPLFFGIILGDVGYGAIGLLLALGVFLKYRKTALGRDIATLLSLSSVFAVFFGFVFGELFGSFGHSIGLRPLWQGRLEAATSLLVFSLVVGVVHVLLSFCFAIAQRLRDRAGKRAAAMAVSIAALCAVFFILGSLAGYLPRGAWLGAVVFLIVCIAVLIYLEGIIAVLELVTALGNILSYARLMALGIASAALAFVTNKLAGATGNVAAAVAVVVVLHGINMVLGLFGPAIQGLRLHMVEFLPRFYEYGGRQFRPFGKGKQNA
ncbi:hypothetical protein EPN96_02555 [bacterium]|nr:MAG: hypothetical protein EPN96_02555 [bacterium]